MSNKTKSAPDNARDLKPENTIQATPPPADLPAPDGTLTTSDARPGDVLRAADGTGLLDSEGRPIGTISAVKPHFSEGDAQRLESIRLPGEQLTALEPQAMATERLADRGAPVDGFDPKDRGEITQVEAVGPSEQVGDRVLFCLGVGVERPADVVHVYQPSDSYPKGALHLAVLTIGAGDNGHLDTRERGDRNLAGHTMAVVNRVAELSQTGEAEVGRYRAR